MVKVGCVAVLLILFPVFCLEFFHSKKNWATFFFRLVCELPRLPRHFCSPPPASLWPVHCPEARVTVTGPCQLSQWACLTAFLLFWQLSGSAETKAADGKRISPLLFMVWLLFCMLVEEFSNIQLCFNMHESIVFSPAALPNLANLCHFYVWRPIRTWRGGWPLTLTGIFGTLGRRWVVGTDLKCLWSHRAGTQASGWVSPLPWPPAPSIVIPLAPARPFIPAHTRHPTPAGPIGNYCRNKSESRLRRRRTGGSLVCSVTSCWHGVRWSDTELNHAVWEQSGPGSLTSVTLSQTSGRDTGCLLFV